MKLFKRTKWKPKQKLRKDDIPFLLAEYRLSKNASYISFSLTISLFAIAVFSFVAFANNPNKTLIEIIMACGIGIFISLWYGDRFRERASQIAEVLQIKKRLKRYGVQDYFTS